MGPWRKTRPGPKEGWPPLLLPCRSSTSADAASATSASGGNRSSMTAEANATLLAHSVLDRRSPVVRIARVRHIKGESARLPGRHLSGLNVTAMDRAMEAAVCCPLRCHKRHRWSCGSGRR
jgi:hypothetical protein